MTRQEAISALKEFFKIKELVCPEIYERDGELAWRYLRTELIETLLILRRDILKVPMIVNNGTRTECGLRCNLSKEVLKYTNENKLYITAHLLGAAVDVVFPTSAKMTAEKARQLIKKNKNLLPYPIRLERDVTWLHVDVFDNGEGNVITEFNG